MTIVTIHKAKTDLSKLIARAEAGEEIVLARGNKPVAKIVGLREAKPEIRGYGSLAHLRGKIPDSFFFDPLSKDELDAWEGKYSFDGEK
ncbi:MULTISPECIES: type II toxin-antitoxin system Phd/YefM family antitoxin [Rhizobium]|uniref:Antitoxin n=1 Tax=Rhizobium leucaenae TaxID=29450 RepID=A0A7W7EMT2_9HYPH|nr:type II toxin-antitoxin system prevent-host-death family antitoxin [Rhizobium leucaenae]MBB4569583.1 prevent-host-death family protein [Rhizobium leucaenae]MBB6299458.1 prevent-host-death family protein [Rhizobium leucaenae]